jgi:hypothetical protein
MQFLSWEGLANDYNPMILITHSVITALIFLLSVEILKTLMWHFYLRRQVRVCRYNLFLKWKLWYLIFGNREKSVTLVCKLQELLAHQLCDMIAVFNLTSSWNALKMMFEHNVLILWFTLWDFWFPYFKSSCGKFICRHD